MGETILCEHIFGETIFDLSYFFKITLCMVGWAATVFVTWHGTYLGLWLRQFSIWPELHHKCMKWLKQFDFISPSKLDEGGT